MKIGWLKLAFFQKEVWLLLKIHTTCCSFPLQTYLSKFANNRCRQIYAMSPDNTCRAKTKWACSLLIFTDKHWTLQKQLRDMIRIQIVYITSNMVNGHHHHSVAIITIWASLLVGPWAARDICTGVKVWPAFPTSMTPGLPFQFQLKSKRIYPITNV